MPTGETETFKKSKLKKGSPTLTFGLKADWVRFNDKSIQKKQPGTKKEILKIDGEEYQLETLNDITETEVSDDENPHEEEAVEFEEDDKSTSDMGGKKENVLILKAENEDLKKRQEKIGKKD